MIGSIKKPLVIYILLGLILILATIFTATKGLSEENKEIYKEAFSMQSHIDKLGFNGFNLSDYKVRFYDGKSDYVAFADKIEKLLKAYYTQDNEETLTLIKEYFEITDERNEVIGLELANVEDFYKTIEGSASYIEANSYMIQNNRKMFEDRYILDFNYTNGGSNYYNIGMLECFILDKLDKDWKDNYDFSKTLDDILKEKSG